MERLADLFTTAGALADTNGDGYADDLALRILAPPADTTPWEWAALADFAAALGLHATGFSPPLVVAVWDGPALALDTTDDTDLAAGTGRAVLAGNRLTVSGADADGRAAMLRALASGSLPDATEWRVIAAQYPRVTEIAADWERVAAVRGDLFMREGDPEGLPGLFLDTDGDRLPDDTRCTLWVADGESPAVWAAVVDLTARIGVETTGLTLPLVLPLTMAVVASGTLYDRLLPVAIETAATEPVEGGIAVFGHRGKYLPNIQIGGATHAETASIVRALATEQPSVAPFLPRPEPRYEETVVWSHEWQGPTEREAIIETLQEISRTWTWRDDAPCDVLVQVSEPAAERAALRDAVRPYFPAGSAITVLPVYHAGRAWLEEVVAPAAKELPGLASLEVTCQPLQPDPYGDLSLDLSIRWLQECWPADEIIAPVLGLPLAQVRIILGAPDQEKTYIARALNDAGGTLGEWTFGWNDGTWPYLPFGDSPAVHRCKGWLTVEQGELIGRMSTDTDLDRFWDFWQGTALPTLGDAIRQCNNGQPNAAAQPFFDELRVEVWVSEPEYALGVREEWESPAEGLAEDIYFNALDYVRTLGEQTTGEAWAEPGQVVPLVHIAPGAPRAVVSLIAYGARIADDTPLPVATRSSGVAMGEVVTDENLPGLLAYLDQHAAVAVRGVGESYRGRPIAAVEVVKPDGAAVRSRSKLAAMKPTHLIVARHHANEVASTTAALKLIEQLATDAAIAPLLDCVNVVVIPDENPDGTALHARLMAEHPTWKHHAARYNAVGVEFADHFHDPDTPYGEARVRPLLWRQWRPDVVTDNHGVPSHEWWQPFAGGTSPPRFRISYWLCQALVYGICRHAPDPAPARFAAALRDAVSAAIGAEEDLAAANRVYAERYERWGHRYLPEKFPATYHGEMLWFFGAAEAKPDAPPRDISLREPQMVSASWITEVLDETAQGAHLALVAKAHLVANLALLRLTADNAPPVTFSVTPLPGGRFRHRLHRIRPLPTAE